jgi:hypothetical protein
MDLTGVSTWLIAQGPIGVLALYLWWEKSKVATQLDKCREQHLADLVKIIGEMKAALVASTEAMRTNAMIQDRAADSARAIAEAVKHLQLSIDNLESDIERMDRKAGA